MPLYYVLFLMLLKYFFNFFSSVFLLYWVWNIQICFILCHVCITSNWIPEELHKNYTWISFFITIIVLKYQKFIMPVVEPNFHLKNDLRDHSILKSLIMVCYTTRTQSLDLESWNYKKIIHECQWWS